MFLFKKGSGREAASECSRLGGRVSIGAHSASKSYGVLSVWESSREDHFSSSLPGRGDGRGGGGSDTAW